MSRNPQTPYACGRCGCEIPSLDAAETCWESVGHCGHAHAEAANERARKVVQPE
jgi:hypothetical protein